MFFVCLRTGIRFSRASLQALGQLVNSAGTDLGLLNFQTTAYFLLRMWLVYSLIITTLLGSPAISHSYCMSGRYACVRCAATFQYPFQLAKHTLERQHRPCNPEGAAESAHLRRGTGTLDRGHANNGTGNNATNNPAGVARANDEAEQPADDEEAVQEVDHQRQIDEMIWRFSTLSNGGRGLNGTDRLSLIEVVKAVYEVSTLYFSYLLQ